MSGHTPGPWYIDMDSETGYCDIRNERPGQKTQWGVATVWHQSGGNPDNSECAPNARLIAAAPELLAALRCAIRHLELSPITEGYIATVNTIRAALAKVAS